MKKKPIKSIYAERVAKIQNEITKITVYGKRFRL
jgi:hypothetical protein